MAPSRAWPALAAVLGAGALLAWPLPREALDWQPSLAWAQPWRWWTGALVHLSGLHLAANLAAVLLLALLGWRSGATRADALAWVLAWPLTQLGLLVQPALLHYGGLSGVLHAGTVILGLRLCLPAQRPPGAARTRRLLGTLVLTALVAKLLVEAPWQGALRHQPGWDFAVAPGAHASGALAGALAWLAVRLLLRR